MSVTVERFRRVLGRLAGGVTVVTTRRPDGRLSGLTATSVCSVSLRPPLVLACLDAGARTHAAVAASGTYALNFLPASARELAVRFSLDEADDKFEGVGFDTGLTGAPLLEEALAWCDCSVDERLPMGDHTIFVGRVEAADLGGAPDARPLLYYLGRYRTLFGSGEERA